MSDTKISALTSATTPLAGTEVLPVVQSGTTVKASVANIQAAPISAGTANGVLYLDGSKVPTSGSVLVFDGSKLGIGGTPTQKLTLAGSADTQLTIRSSTTTGASEIYFGDSDAIFRGAISYGHTADALSIYTAATKAVGIDSSQNLSLTAGNLIQGTAAKGINFTANTPLAGMTSQLLNDYEEGTWTPTDTSGAGLTLTNNITATYRKVGKLMFFALDVTYPSTADTSPTSISLPTGASVLSSAAVGYSTIGAVPYAAISGSNLNLYLASTFASLTNANASTKRFVVSGCYPL